MSGQQPQCSVVSRMSGIRRLFFVSLLGRRWLRRRRAFGAAPYPLLGREAPDFALHALVGSNVRLSEHLGDVVVVSFWGSRCGPCGMQLDALNRSLATYQSAGLRVFAVERRRRSGARSRIREGTVGFISAAARSFQVGEPAVSGGQPADDTAHRSWRSGPSRASRLQREG